MNKKSNPRRRCPLLDGRGIDDGRCFDYVEISLSPQPLKLAFVDELEKIAKDNSVSLTTVCDLCKAHAIFLNIDT